MPNTDQLEQNAKAHRAHLTDQISELASSVKPEERAKQALGQTSDLGQSITTAVIQGAKRNPAGLAMIGLGAAAIALTASKPANSETHLADYDDMGGHDKRIARADERLRARARANTGRFAQTQSASKLRKSLDRGLDHLSPEARQRVTDARLKVIDAQEEFERKARRTAQQTQEAHQNQPFLTGAIAAAVGALVGALLPTTRTETDLMGASRDKLMRDAEAVMRDEIQALEHQGKAALESGIQSARSEFADAQSSS